MNPMEIAALAVAAMTVTVAVAAILIIRLVIHGTKSSDRAQILNSTATLILAIRGKR